MEKLLIILLLLIRGGQLYAQKIPDTLHVATDRLDSGITKYYVIGGCKEMVVFQNEEKCDTSFYDNISLGEPLHSEKMKEILSKVHLLYLKDKKEISNQTLSGGEKQ